MHTEQVVSAERQPKCLPDLYASGVVPPTLDVVQDYPAAWDWRLIVGILIAGIASLYLF